MTSTDVRDAAVAHLASLPPHLKERYSAELIRRMLCEIGRLDELRRVDGESMWLMAKGCQEYKDSLAITSAERDAMEWAIATLEGVEDLMRTCDEDESDLDTLRHLLERMK